MERNDDFVALMSEIELLVWKVKEEGGALQIEGIPDGKETIMKMSITFPRRRRVRRSISPNAKAVA